MLHSGEVHGKGLHLGSCAGWWTCMVKGAVCGAPGKWAKATAADCCCNCLPIPVGWIDSVLLLQWGYPPANNGVSHSCMKQVTESSAEDVAAEV